MTGLQVPLVCVFRILNADHKDPNDMFHRLFNRIKRNKLVSAGDYGRGLTRYRKEHPESLVEEREEIHQWVRIIEKRKRERIEVDEKEPPLLDELKRAWVVYRMWETARAAFMSHPAATEIDFRKCWPSIHEELLKRHALEELAGNPGASNRPAEIADSDEIFGAETPNISSLQH
jgi:hypothetical protein